MNANRLKSNRGPRPASGPLPSLDLNDRAAGRGSRHDEAGRGPPNSGATPDDEARGSGQRRRSSQPKAKAVRESVPPPKPPPAASADREAEELETRIFALVTAVAENDGREYPPEWAAVADAAKRRGYLEEKSLRLYLRAHGKQWLASRAGQAARAYTMTKIDPAARLALKDLANDTGVPMQEILGLVVGVIHEHRAELTSAAFKAGERYPWEAIGVLLRAGRK